MAALVSLCLGRVVTLPAGDVVEIIGHEHTGVLWLRVCVVEPVTLARGMVFLVDPVMALDAEIAEPRPVRIACNPPPMTAADVEAITAAVRAEPPCPEPGPEALVPSPRVTVAADRPDPRRAYDVDPAFERDPRGRLDAGAREILTPRCTLGAWCLFQTGHAGPCTPRPANTIPPADFGPRAATSTRRGGA